MGLKLSGFALKSVKFQVSMPQSSPKKFLCHWNHHDATTMHAVCKNMLNNLCASMALAEWVGIHRELRNKQ